MSAYLIGVEGEHQGRSIPIDRDGMIIGRDPSSSISIKDASVMQQHAIVRTYNESYYLQEMNNSGGILINGQATTAQALHDGDRIQIGQSLFTFQVKDRNTDDVPASPINDYPQSIESTHYKTPGGLFSADGRYNRAKYFWTSIGINVISYVLSFSIGFIVVYSGGETETAQVLAFIFVSVPLTVLAVFNAIKRFHDLDRPGSHYWYLLIPLYNIYLGLVLLFQKGTSGENRYGPDPISD